MDKQAAENLITNTFNRPFDESRFSNFIRNLLNDIDESKAFSYLYGTYIRHSFADHVKQYRRIGAYTDPNGERVDVLIVHLKRETALEHARTRQRNFIAWYLNGGRGGILRDAALVAFVSPDLDDWRFSCVRMEYKEKATESGKVKVKEELTPAKRYSFLVGKNEPNHTAQQQLMPLLQNDSGNPTISELEDAFSVEAVTQQFYLDYKGLFEKLTKELDHILEKDTKIKQEFETKSIDTANFAKKLLGQIVFLYFLQKKGWLGVAKDERWGQGDKKFLGTLLRRCIAENKNFFNDYLEYLFYEALATTEGRATIDLSYYPKFDCKIPFLNGGLFEATYDWKNTNILLPDELFSNKEKTKGGDTGTGILDIFDRYNFTVKEDEPLEKEVAVDPEMLGKVFENLLPENLRKGQGAYYTPREVVHYMCQESLINYLDTAVNTGEISLSQDKPAQEKLFGDSEPEQLNLKGTGYKTIIPKKHIEDFIHKGEFAIEHDTAKEEGAKTYKYQVDESIRKNAKLLDEKLETIKICDPAIGSGAFPVGMMHEIVKARNVLETYLKTGKKAYEFKRHCIQESIYGVDIDPGAIEIAKLRLWLSLVVDEENYLDIKPLPNLDYKIMQGNSLLEDFHGVSLNLEKSDELLFSENEELDLLIEDLHRKQGEFFNAIHHSDKIRLREEVEDAIIKVFHYELKRRQEQYFKALDRINKMASGFPKEEDRKKCYDDEKAKLDKRYKFDFEAVENELREMTHGNKIRNFFPWKLYFADLFRKNSGFDVVIANPPYIRQESITNLKPLLKKAGYEVYNSTSDIYTYFYEKSYQILKPEGFSTFITSNKWMRAKYGENLRKFFKNKTTLLNMIDFGGYKVFEATVDTNILIFKKETPTSDHFLNAVNIQTDFANDTKLDTYSKKHHLSIAQKEIDSKCFSFADDATMKIKAKIEANGTSLKYWDAKIYRGIITGFNKAFIIDTVTKEKLIREDSKSTEIIKPVLRGRDIGRYYYKWADLWIIVIPSGWTNQNKGKEKPEVFFKNYFPAIYDHLKGIGDKVENGKIKAKGKGLYKRDDQGNYWWELRDCDYYPEFKKEKIIY
ncbi:MAG: Eco57I restriction-modification methylase domain-containing protein, partial [Syntrophobacterales bacterium]|nr:Eco57I restriction-modification methylase domain-containing protein [Syntrophobacterales bacterium]